jgi:hypothetical protein
MIELSEAFKMTLIETAKDLHGAERRLFMARRIPCRSRGATVSSTGLEELAATILTALGKQHD